VCHSRRNRINHGDNMNETSIRKGTIMKRTFTLALVGLACLMAMPSIAHARYRDGMNLYQYVGSNPLNRVDPSGLKWKVARKTDEATALATPEVGDTFSDLARDLSLNEQELLKWMTWSCKGYPSFTKPDSGYAGVRVNKSIKDCCEFRVPNTMVGIIVDATASSDIRMFRYKLNYWQTDQEKEGFRVVVYGIGQGQDRLQKAAAKPAGHTKERLIADGGPLKERGIYGLYLLGHGSARSDEMSAMYGPRISPNDVIGALPYKLGYLWLDTCGTARHATWKGVVHVAANAKGFHNTIISVIPKPLNDDIWTPDMDSITLKQIWTYDEMKPVGGR
jgi:hypothetical protein